MPLNLQNSGWLQTKMQIQGGKNTTNEKNEKVKIRKNGTILCYIAKNSAEQNLPSIFISLFPNKQ